MKARRGQVALYLVLALVAIAVLMLMNVNAFLAVRAKNRLMNAADEAALAAAKCQGRLLNELGNLNVEHLKTLIANRFWNQEQTDAMRQLAAFGPLAALDESSQEALKWLDDEGRENAALAQSLRQHVSEIIDEYLPNPDLYPGYYENFWSDYASALSAALNRNPRVLPYYVETASAWSQQPLLSPAFYDAIAARAWCWFSLGNRERYFDYDSRSMPRPEFTEAAVQENSEVYSLHVTFKTWNDSPWHGVFDESWTNFICQVTGCTRTELAASSLVVGENEVFAFYDEYWRPWSTSFNPDNFPIAGTVRPEYDVAGAVASVMINGQIPELLKNDEVSSRELTVSAEAKPLGTVVTPEGATAPVTAFNSFIAPSRPGERIFTEAQLVLMGSVPRAAGLTMSPSWYTHVKEHLPAYFAEGPGPNGCYYCRQLVQWEQPAFRAEAHEWLLRNHESCTVSGGNDTQKGGYEWGH